MATGEQDRATDGNEAWAWLERVRRVSLGMTSFQARLQSYESRYDRRETIASEARVLFRSPGSYRIEMLHSTKAAMSGAHVVYHAGDAHVRVRPGGLLKLLALTLPLGDPQLLSLNRYRLDQVTGEAILDRLARPEYSLALAGDAKVGGQRLTLLRASARTNPLDAHIAEEVIGCDKAGRFRFWQALGRRELGLRDDLLYQLVVTDLIPEAPVTAEAFKL